MRRGYPKGKGAAPPNGAAVPFALSAAERKAVARGWSEHPALTAMGIRTEIGRDRVEAILSPVEPYHRGGLGTEAVNGGVLAALFDLVLGLPGHLCLAARTATLELSITFMRPVHGDVVRAQGWCERVTAHHAFTAARILDARGIVCARANGIVARVDRGAPR